MKKILLSLMTFAIVFMLIPFVYAKEKVPVYMITKEGCPACQQANEYFASLASDYSDIFELIELQVFDSNWNFVSTDLQNMFVAVYENFGEDPTRAATPTIVIGDYYTVGLPSDSDVLKNKIIETYESEEKVDVVKDLAKSLDIDINSIRKESTNEEKTNSYDALIIIGVFVVLVGGFAGLVVASKK